MATNDQSQYVLRYNEITGNLEYQSGLNWTAISVGGSGATVVASASFSGRTSDIPTTTLFTAAQTALYQISIYVVNTVGDGGGASPTINGSYTDDYGVTALPSVPSVDSNAGSRAMAINVVEVTSGSSVTYEALGGSYTPLTYSFYISAVKLR